MKKFAAHYLLTDSGLLIKNGIAVATDTGAFQFIDPKGELIEMEQMIFHSGLMISAFEFIKKDDLHDVPHENEKHLQLLDSALKRDHLSLKEVIELTGQLQEQLPELNIPQLLDKIEQAFISRTFVKKTIPGLYLLTGLDLNNLRFTDRTRLKKVM
jgi:hypothetical protein